MLCFIYLIKEIDVKLIDILVTNEPAYGSLPVCYHNNITARLARWRKDALIRTQLQTDFMRSFFLIFWQFKLLFGWLIHKFTHVTTAEVVWQICDVIELLLLYTRKQHDFY